MIIYDIFTVFAFWAIKNIAGNEPINRDLRFAPLVTLRSAGKSRSAQYPSRHLAHSQAAGNPRAAIRRRLGQPEGATKQATDSPRRAGTRMASIVKPSEMGQGRRGLTGEYRPARACDNTLVTTLPRDQGSAAAVGHAGDDVVRRSLAMAASADRHLLFGLLALQNGIVSQSQLLYAFQAWTLDKSKSLADHLEVRGDLTGPKRAALEVLASAHLETHDGDVEKSLAAVPANRFAPAPAWPRLASPTSRPR